MKELDELKEKCFQAMKDVDTFVSEHYNELLDDMNQQCAIPDNWEMKIVSNCGVVTGMFRPSATDEWRGVVYNEGTWYQLYD